MCALIGWSVGRSASGRASGLVVSKELCEEASRVVEEVCCDVHGVDLRPGRWRGSIIVELVDRRVGVGHQQRGVRGHDELAALIDQVMDANQQLQLAMDRERRFGFVEQEEAVRPEPVDDQINERLAVRSLVR